MKKSIILTLSFLCIAFALQAQKYMTRTGHIKFESETPLEKIEADNNQVSSILNTENGEMVFAVLMKSFQFEKALMQEHFNEKYVESEKFPKSTFKGKIKDIAGVDFTKDGVYEVQVEGELSLHGITKSVNTPGSIEVKDGKISALASFS
ncbi:MAG: YceI family protein, partial [Bacteroidota bacterium]